MSVSYIFSGYPIQISSNSNWCCGIQEANTITNKSNYLHIERRLGNEVISNSILLPAKTYRVQPSLSIDLFLAYMWVNWGILGLAALQFASYLLIRVANVVADHDDLLTQWRPIKMSKFCANIFLIGTSSNYFWTSEVSKNQVLKSQFFSCSHASNQRIMKIW